MISSNLFVCEQCQQIHNQYDLTNERLLMAQQELARFDPGRNGQFQVLWATCDNSLKEIWRLREEMALHLAAHQQQASASAYV